MTSSDATPEVSQLFDAVAQGDTARLGAWLRGRPSLARERNAAGVSLILTALYHRQRACADLLLAARPELDLFEAAALGALQPLEQRLREDGARTASRSADGFTALHLAVFFAQPAAARILLSHGADPRAVAANPMRVQPLHSAVAAGDAECVALLLEHGAEVDAEQQGGFTPLQGAAFAGQRALCVLLLERGADPRKQNSQGRDAISLARERGHADLATWLEGQ